MAIEINILGLILSNMGVLYNPKARGNSWTKQDYGEQAGNSFRHGIKNYKKIPLNYKNDLSPGGSPASVKHEIGTNRS